MEFWNKYIKKFNSWWYGNRFRLYRLCISGNILGAVCIRVLEYKHEQEIQDS